jgi:serine/threonine protein kinase
MNECEILLFVGLQILKLEHPNIIEIYEVYDNPGFFYIVMEYCEGGELYAPNNFHRCSNETQIAEIVLTITDALDFCHSKNIVHRDIKVPFSKPRYSTLNQGPLSAS